MLCGEIMRQRGDISDSEWNFFLRGSGSLDKVRILRPSGVMHYSFYIMKIYRNFSNLCCLWAVLIFSILKRPYSLLLNYRARSFWLGYRGTQRISLRASSPGRSGWGAGKGRRACNYVSEIWISASKNDAKCWLAEMISVMTSLPLASVFQCLFTFELVSASRWLAEIWQLSRRGATGELEVEFKFQRRSCKPSFLFALRHQSTPESLLAG